MTDSNTTPLATPSSEIEKVLSTGSGVGAPAARLVTSGSGAINGSNEKPPAATVIKTSKTGGVPSEQFVWDKKLKGRSMVRARAWYIE